MEQSMVARSAESLAAEKVALTANKKADSMDEKKVDKTVEM